MVRFGIQHPILCKEWALIHASAARIALVGLRGQRRKNSVKI